MQPDPNKVLTVPQLGSVFWLDPEDESVLWHAAMFNDGRVDWLTEDGLGCSGPVEFDLLDEDERRPLEAVHDLLKLLNKEGTHAA